MCALSVYVNTCMCNGAYAYISHKEGLGTLKEQD